MFGSHGLDTEHGWTAPAFAFWKAPRKDFSQLKEKIKSFLEIFQVGLGTFLKESLLILTGL